MVKVRQRPFTSQHGETYHTQSETHLIAIIYRLITVTDIFRNTNLLRLEPILFPATLRSDRVQDQIWMGFQAATSFRAALQTRPRS